MVSISYNPYEGVIWSDLTMPEAGIPPKWEGHCHPRASAPHPYNKPHGVIDLYSGDIADDDGNDIVEPYTLFGPTFSDDPSYWPWSALTDLSSEFEDRDPETVRDGDGVIACPTGEMHFGVHTTCLFWGGDFTDIRLGGIPEKLRDPVTKSNLGEPGAIVGFAHPHRYWAGDKPTGRDYEQYLFNMEGMLNHDGAIVMELFSRLGGFPTRDIILWDKLLTDFATEGLIWGLGHDDPVEASGQNRLYRVGDSVDCRWTSVLLHNDEFDVSDQSSSRQATHDAIKDGRIFAHERNRWDPDSETPADPPMPTEIDVNDESITIEYDDGSGGETVVKWISSGEVVTTGPTITLDDSHFPYVRAQLETGSNIDTESVIDEDIDAITATQPWMIAHS